MVRPARVVRVGRDTGVCRARRPGHAGRSGRVRQAPRPPRRRRPAHRRPAPQSRPDHVVIVMLENKDEGDVLREGPYLASLAASGASLTDMHAETHPSQPNYLALFSGDTQGVDDDRCPLTSTAPTSAASSPPPATPSPATPRTSPGRGSPAAPPATTRASTAPGPTSATSPPTANQPLSAMPSDYARLPTVSFVIPNLCHDMHDCSIAEGDELAAGRTSTPTRSGRAPTTAC